MIITKKGVPTEVKGTQPTVGELAPAFSLKNLEEAIVSNETLKGHVALLSIFPDIDTRVCDMQTRHFFESAKDVTDVRIVNISNNTPEQLTSWCATAGIDVEMLSDEKHEFADAFGIWMPEFEVLARSIFVIDRDGTLIYSEIVPEMAQEPNYEAALDAARNAS